MSQFGFVQRFNEAGDGLFLNSEILHLDRIDIISGPTDRNSAYPLHCGCWLKKISGMTS